MVIVVGFGDEDGELFSPAGEHESLLSHRNDRSETTLPSVV
jgi:hypothetical protein